VGIPVLGIIENMSYLICGHCGEPTPIFGKGGGHQLAEELAAPLLGQVPIDPRICAAGDGGEPLTIRAMRNSKETAVSDSEIGQVFMQIAASLHATFCPL
jgi:ATP-binding protein involved in chromosome partitioning